MKIFTLIITLLIALLSEGFSQTQTVSPNPNYTGVSQENNLKIYMFLESQPKSRNAIALKGYYFDENNLNPVDVIGVKSMNNNLVELKLVDEKKKAVFYMAGTIDEQNIVKGVKQDSNKTKLFSFTLYPSSYPRIR